MILSIFAIFVILWHEKSLYRRCTTYTALFIDFLFTIDQLEQIQKVSLAQIICSNSDYSIKELQPKVFRTPDEYVVLAFSNIKNFFKLKNNIFALLYFNNFIAFFHVTHLLLKLWMNWKYYVLLSFLNKRVPCAKIPGIDFAKMLPL
jgi:hypothetical protein